MENVINISQCDNQLFLVAVNGQESYTIADIKSGYNNGVDVNLQLTEGDYTAPFIADGVEHAIHETANVALPKGNYELVYMGLNWGGAYNFDLEFNGKNFKLENDPKKPLVGAIWNKGDLNIPFTV